MSCSESRTTLPTTPGEDTSMPDNQSEVRRLLQRIEQEYQAAQAALNGYAVTARHDFITARLENMGRARDRLQQLVGDKATRLMAECIEALPD